MTNEILVVDDNLDIRLLISGILKDKGFTVREAANFDQALMEINKKAPEVAIIDVKLDKGDNDGIELLVHLKKIDEDIPVIMISGHANVQMAVDSLKLGAFEFIQKPFSSERLRNYLDIDDSEYVKDEAARPWTIAFGHHSVFSNGTHGDTDFFTRLYWDWFLEGRVDLYLSGHNHHLAHLQHGNICLLYTSPSPRD